MVEEHHQQTPFFLDPKALMHREHNQRHLIAMDEFEPKSYIGLIEKKPTNKISITGLSFIVGLETQR